METATDSASSVEADLRPLDPRVRLLWWIEAAIAAFATAGIVGIVDLLAPLPTPRGLLTTGVVALGALLAGIMPPIRYRRWRYALREDDLWLRRGVLWITVSAIPYRRLQFVDTRQGPLERLLGLSQLVVHTAALGTSGHLPGLDIATAERLRERLAQVEPDVPAV